MLAITKSCCWLICWFLSSDSRQIYGNPNQAVQLEGRWGGCLWSILNKPKKKSSYIPQTNLLCCQEPSQSDFSCIFIHQRHQFAPLPSPLLLAHGHRFFCAKGVKQMLPPETRASAKSKLILDERGHFDPLFSHHLSNQKNKASKDPHKCNKSWQRGL